jgi:CHAT domain-containing protein
MVGNWEDAISESETALSLFEKIGNKEGQANSWAELTGVYSDRTSSVKDFNKAEECYRKALDLGHGKILDLDLMEIHLQTGRYSEAAKIARDRVQDCLKDKDDSCRAHALISLSEAERLSGNVRDSRAALNEARPLVSRSPELYLRGRLMYQESRLLASEGKLNDALASYQRLISLLESVKGKLDAQEQKSIAENYGFIYDELVSLLYSMSKKAPKDQLKLASESLEYAERNKARQFAETWGRVFKNQIRLALAPTLQEREQALYAQRDRVMAKLEAASDGESTSKAIKATLEADLASVQGEIVRFVEELRRVSPQYAAVAYPEDIRISALPLRIGETLVEFKMTERSTFVWIVRSPDGSNKELVAFYEVPQKQAWFVERLALLRKAINSGYPEAVDWRISEELFAALFPAEARQVIEHSQEIIFIPDDALFVLPLELLSPSASKGDFLFLKKATTYYPSAVSLKLRRTANHSSNWQSALLGIADPITSPDDERFELAHALKPPGKNPVNETIEINTDGRASDPGRLKSRGFSFERLPGTATELQTIAALLKERKEPVEVRFGVNATKTELLDTDLSKFRFLHFATHGVLPVDTGTLAAVERLTATDSSNSTGTTTSTGTSEQNPTEVRRVQ